MTYIAGQISSSGLAIAPLSGTSEAGLTGTLDFLIAQFQSIYGATIDFTSKTPDGQLVNTFAQMVSDVLQFVYMCNAGFDPDQAMSIILRIRVGINGIQAQDATYSVVSEQMVFSGACTLYGLDQTIQPVYTITDAQGNQWQLINTVSIIAGGTQNFPFQAANPGAVLAPASTITTPSTIVIQVTSVTNPVAAIPGVNEEQDAALKLRRWQSVAIGSIAQTQGMKAALLNIPGVLYANVYENDTSGTDSNNVPSHSIWVVVSPGSATNEEIANAIYVKRGEGCGIYASSDAQTYAVPQPDGTVFIVSWDTLIAQDMYVQFAVTGINPYTLPNVAAIFTGLEDAFNPAPGTSVNINEIATLIQSIDPNTLCTDMGLCLTEMGTYTPVLSPTAVNNYLAIISSRIIMFYTGTQNISAYGGPGGSVNQQIIASPYNPATNGVVPLSVVVGNQIDFSLFGGLSTTYSYSFYLNSSGATFAFNAGNVTGTYTAGTTPGGYDILEFQDGLGNTGYVVIQVLT